MSTTSTRIPTRLVDTIGILAVIVGLVLGLVPGIAVVPDAQADESCDPIVVNNRTIDRVRLELSKDSGSLPEDVVVDTTDPNVRCEVQGNVLYLFISGLDGSGELAVEVESNVPDAPGFHTSCSVDYDGDPDDPNNNPKQLSIGDSIYTVDEVFWSFLSAPGQSADNCDQFPSEVQVEKIDSDGNGLEGATFHIWSGNSAGEIEDAVASCTTGPTGGCSFGEVDAGTYTIDETTVPPGYTKAQGLPETFQVPANGFVELGPYTNPRIDYEIDVTPDGRNAVGNTHDFIVTLETGDGAPLADATVALSWSGVGSIQSPGSTCTTNASGQCTVTVKSDDPGAGVLTATFDTPYDNHNGQTAGPDLDDEVSVSTDGTAYDQIADAASKTWVGYEVTISPDDTNLLGDLHPFTVTVYEVDGSGTPDRVIAPNVDVVVSWSGTPAGSTLDTTTCTTDASGECVFTVDSDANAGAGTLEVESVEGTVAGLDSGTETLTVTFADDEIEAEKTWREYRALIDDDSVNPIDTAHTFDVQVQYRESAADSWTDAGSGLVVTWSSSGDGVVVEDDGDVAGVTGSTCDEGTNGDGECTIVVHSATTGDRSVTVLSVTGDLLPGDDDVPGSDELEYTFRDVAYTSQPDNADETATKTWLDFGATIESTGHNQVDEPHTFTIEVFRTDGSQVEPDVANGTKVDVEITWAQPHADNEVVSNTCETTGTVADECTVTLNNGAAGTATVKVLGLDDYSFGGVVQDFTFASQPTASKTWYAYRASIEDDGVNLVGDDHPFTVTAEVNDGTGWDLVPGGTTITVTSSGVGTIDTLTCETVGATGACVVTVNSSLPGDRDVTVSTVEATQTDDPTDTADVSAGTHLEGDQSTTATKTWIDYSATISGDAINLTGQDHTFRVEAFKDSGSGDEPVPAGTEVGVSLSDSAFLVTDTCADGTGDDPDTAAAETNVCFVTVGSSDVDEVTVTVDTVEAVEVDDAPDANISGVSATKTWIEVLVTVEADETNIVDEDHVFTIDVDLDTPEGPAEPSSGTVVATTSGVGQEDGQTCDTGLDAAGTCTVTVSSTESGDRIVTAESVTFTYDGTTFSDVDLDGAVGVSNDSDLAATKTWRAYRASIEADGFNAVRDPHTFTVTIEQTDVANPTEDDWDAVPNGTTADVAITAGPGSITSNACEAPGTAGDTGTCSVTINSTVAGTTTVTVSEISVAHPTTQADTSVDVTNDGADKTWIAFRGLIIRDSLNVTGDDHTFFVNVEYTTDGTTWLQVPNTSNVGISDDSADPDSVGGMDDDTCGSTVATAAAGDVPAHVCTVTVLSTDPGSLAVTVDEVSTADITANGITESFDVTFADGAVGVLDGFDADDYTATKTWASYALQLTPADAVNLLDGSDDDPERFHTITASLTSDAQDAADAPVGGQTINVTISGDTGIITDVESGTVAADGLSAECITDTDGTCDIEIFSSVTGDAEVNASYEATVGESDPVSVVADTDLETDGVQGATKTWTTFRVTVTPVEATNLVGNPHTFTVLVEQSNNDGAWLPVIDAVPSISLDADTATITGNTCVDGTVAAGTCLVTVGSDNVEAVTLTATYEASVGQTTAAFSDRGDKTWIDFGIDVTPDTDENLVGTDHVFTVTVTTTFPVENGTTTERIVGAVPTIQLNGLGSISANTCAAGTVADDPLTGVNEAGTCQVTISSAVAGESSLTAVYMGTAADDDEIRPFSDTGLKDWVDYELEISPDAVNAVGDAHTFTATLTVDTGGGFGPAAGENLQFTFDGVGSVTGGDVDADLGCTTDAAGQCDIVINSDEGGTSTVGVSYGAVAGTTSETLTRDAVKTWVDISLVKTAVVGDGFGDGDLVADPDTGLPTLFFTTTDRGPKTAVFEYLITNTGADTLFDLALVDDRLGDIDLATQSDCPGVLAVGASCTARATEQYTYEDAAGGLDNIIVNVGVVTASGEDGSEVSDTDDAVIQLIAQQSSILIDLQKDVVVGAGDVEAPDGPPTVTWSQSELEAGASKVVRYAFTVTNIGPSPIVDVELVDPMISSQPIIAVADGVTLQPGESTVVEVDYVLSADEAFPDGPTAGELPNVASVSGANETRDAFDQDSDDAIVFVQVVFAEQDQRPLPATGLGSGGLLPLAVLLVAVGAAILWLDRRRVTGR